MEENQLDYKKTEQAVNITREDVDPPDGSNKQNDLQQQAQKIADAMLAKKMKGMPSKEELKAFKEWQETQQITESQEDKEQLELQQELERLRNENTQYKNKSAALANKVMPQFADYIVFEVCKNMGDSDDFEIMLKDYLKNNPQYVEDDKQTKAWGTRQSSTSSRIESGVEAAFKKLNPDLKL